jgi:hypothetical protein
MNILLYDGDTAETVSNVLVGEPSVSSPTEPGSGQALSYTLAIPKGDSHTWTDRIVEFFGRKFRTVGYPQEGIEENIPLDWNKKIRVQMLVINGSCTVYEKDTFVRHVFDSVYLSDNRGETVQKDGVQTTGELTVKICGAFGENYKPKIGDTVVVDCCDFLFDTSSQKSLSESFAEFRKEYPDFAVVRNVVKQMYGEIPDYEISAR